MSSNTKEPEKDIISFDQALELCSLGFDEPTFCMYEIENRQLCLCYLDEEGLYMPDKDLHAPTKSQVFRWFRENYTRLYTDLFVDDDQTFGYAISYFISEGRVDKPYKRQFTTYEQAEDACINELIELAKQQSNSDDTLSKQQDNE